MSGVDHVDDLKCDEMGCWECVSVKKVSEKKCHKEDVFKLTRRYYSNGSLPSLKRIIKNLGGNKSIPIKRNSIRLCPRLRDKFELMIN